MDRKALEALISGTFSQYLANIFSQIPQDPEDDLSDMINEFVDSFEDLDENERITKLSEILNILLSYLKGYNK